VRRRVNGRRHARGERSLVRHRVSTCAGERSVVRHRASTGAGGTLPGASSGVYMLGGNGPGASSHVDMGGGSVPERFVAQRPRTGERSTLGARVDMGRGSAPGCLVGRLQGAGEEHRPSLHDRPIDIASPWSRELRGHMPARPAPPCLISGFCSSARGCTPRFLQTPLAGPPLRFASISVA